MPPQKALTLVLAGSGLKVRAAGTGRYIIEIDRPTTGASPRVEAAGRDAPDADIVVTGSKRAITEARFPGAVRIIPTGSDDPLFPGIRSSGELVARPKRLDA